ALGYPWLLFCFWIHSWSRSSRFSKPGNHHDDKILCRVLLDDYRRYTPGSSFSNPCGRGVCLVCVAHAQRESLSITVYCHQRDIVGAAALIGSLDQFVGERDAE